MTQAGKEGINLYSIRQIHIIDPWWNNIINHQIIGRGLRICGHHHIPISNFYDYSEKEPKPAGKMLVNIFIYIAVIKSSILDSIDFIITKKSLQKAYKTKLFLDLIKKNSIDYNIY